MSASTLPDYRDRFQTAQSVTSGYSGRRSCTICLKSIRRCSSASHGWNRRKSCGRFYPVGVPEKALAGSSRVREALAALLWSGCFCGCIPPAGKEPLKWRTVWQQCLILWLKNGLDCATLTAVAKCIVRTAVLIARAALCLLRCWACQEGRRADKCSQSSAGHLYIQRKRTLCLPFTAEVSPHGLLVRSPDTCVARQSPSLVICSKYNTAERLPGKHAARLGNLSSFEIITL